MINKEDFLRQIEKNALAGVELIKKKNQDYCGDNPYKSFEGATFVGLTVEQGILVVVMNKISRVVNLLENESQVKSESINDTLIDIQNYINILNTYVQLQKSSKQNIEKWDSQIR